MQKVHLRISGRVIKCIFLTNAVLVSVLAGRPASAPGFLLWQLHSHLQLENQPYVFIEGSQTNAGYQTITFAFDICVQLVIGYFLLFLSHVQLPSGETQGSENY